MRLHRIFSILVFVGTSLVISTKLAHSLHRDVLSSVVSVLPVWSNSNQVGTARPSDAKPEGSGVVIRDGVIVTAWHVIDRAETIEIRLNDGRILPTRLIAKDEASDIALISVETELNPIEIAPEPQLAESVCAIGNAYGFGLSVTCGVVSATFVTNAGFNPVEDFVQTDAAINPGMSGGALVDKNGRLVGMISAIFSSKSDTNIGVNFAASVPLLLRVANDLIDHGEVRYPKPGWRLNLANRTQLKSLAAPVVDAVSNGSPASKAGVKPGDRIVKIGQRSVQTPKDVITALAIVPMDQATVEISLQRGGQAVIVSLPLESDEVTETTPVTRDSGDCAHSAPVCLLRQAVFPVSSYDPIASGTRIGPNLVVTNRHVVGDRMDAIVHTPNGPREAKVIPSAYSGDLVLLEVEGMPEAGYIPDLENSVLENSTYHAVGADIARKEVRVFDRGELISKPAEGAELGRVHVTSRMQPGVSGGALVDHRGELVGIAVGGGDDRFEAIPIDDVKELVELRLSDEAEEITKNLGSAYVACSKLIEKFQTGSGNERGSQEFTNTCLTAENHGQLLEAGRVLARAGNFDGAQALHGLAVDQVPNSINARISLLVSLQLAADFEQMTDHARKLIGMAPDDPQALRFAIQAGVWGDDQELAEDGYKALLKADPRQAEAARRFIDSAPPAPVRR